MMLSVGTLLLSSMALLSAEPLLPFGVVDTHVHLMLTTNGINYTWTKPTPPSNCPCRPPCSCNMSLPEYHAASSPTAAADYIVFCEVSAEPADWLKESRWVQQMATEQQQQQLQQRGEEEEEEEEASGTMRAPQAALPKIGAIMAHPPPGFGTKPSSAYTASLDTIQKEIPLLRGVRAYLDYGANKKLDPSAPLSKALLLDGLNELGKRGLVVDTFVPEITDARVHAVVSAAEKTTFIVEHFGCGCSVEDFNVTEFKRWEESLHKLAALENIACFQLGGTMAGFGSIEKVNKTVIKPFLQAAVAAFGYDRLCFEANWFFSNWVDSLDGYGEWARILVPMLKENGATAADLKKVFRDNAIKVYNIKEGDEKENAEEDAAVQVE